MRWMRMIDLEHVQIRPTYRPRASLSAGAGLATVAGPSWSLLALGAIPGAHGFRSATGAGLPTIEATHLPPLFTTDADSPSALRYDVACPTPESDEGSGCAIEGNVYVRAGQSGPLPTSGPAARSGSVVRDRRSGASLTLPAGGAVAPQRSLRLSNPIAVELATRRFGAPRTASPRVAAARWGNGQIDAGLEEGPATPTDRSVVFRRRRERGRDHPRRSTQEAPEIGEPGSCSLLCRAARRSRDPRRPGDPPGRWNVRARVGAEPGGTPLLRGFDATGKAVGAWHALERTAAAVRNMLRKVHGPYTADRFRRGDGAPNVTYAKSGLIRMDALASSNHIGLIYAGNADGTDQIIEAKGRGVRHEYLDAHVPRRPGARRCPPTQVDRMTGSAPGVGVCPPRGFAATAVALLATALSFVGGACSASPRSPTVLADGSSVRAAPPELTGLGQPVVVTSVRTVSSAGLIHTRTGVLRHLPARFRPNHTDGRRRPCRRERSSVTFRPRGARIVFGCMSGPSGGGHPVRWCGHVVGELRAGRLIDLRLDIACRLPAGSAVGSAWVDPVAARPMDRRTRPRQAPGLRDGGLAWGSGDDDRGKSPDGYRRVPKRAIRQVWRPRREVDAPSRSGRLTPLDAGGTTRIRA
jgi:hypothetical protein